MALETDQLLAVLLYSCYVAWQAIGSSR